MDLFTEDSDDLESIYSTSNLSNSTWGGTGPHVRHLVSFILCFLACFQRGELINPLQFWVERHVFWVVVVLVAALVFSVYFWWCVKQFFQEIKDIFCSCEHFSNVCLFWKKERAGGNEDEIEARCYYHGNNQNNEEPFVRIEISRGSSHTSNQTKIDGFIGQEEDKENTERNVKNRKKNVTGKSSNNHIIGKPSKNDLASSNTFVNKRESNLEVFKEGNSTSQRPNLTTKINKPLNNYVETHHFLDMKPKDREMEGKLQETKTAPPRPGSPPYLVRWYPPSGPQRYQNSEIVQKPYGLASNSKMVLESTEKEESSSEARLGMNATLPTGRARIFAVLGGDGDFRETYV